ncbi:MAG: hypothetical protein EHM72_15200, partial [Calditrichaeota bacterium]
MLGASTKMINFSRRNFTKSGLTNTAALPLTAHPISFPQVLTAQEMVFQVYPHAWMPEKLWLYAADEFDDPFESGIALKSEGIVVPSELGERLFSLNVRWFVEGFGYVVLTADNGSEYYSLKCFTRNPILNLNFELFKSRIMRNRRVQTRYEKEGVLFSHEIRYLSSIAEQFYADAVKTNSVKQADYADRGLMYALWAGEKIELERAQYHIESNRRTDLVHFGCETRQYIWAKSEEFTRQFARLFNFATVTHYIWDTWYEVFEPSEGRYNWGVKDNIVNWLGENDITIQGRPLFWFHHSVTPTWLKGKSFDELKKYVVDHTRNVVGHYGDRVMQWEVINEYHDWANIHEHSAKQTIEITKLACDTVKEMNPEIVTIINNCCPFAEYAAT